MRCLRRFCLRLGNEPLVSHECQHNVAPLSHAIRIFQWIVERRTFGHCRQSSRFSQSELRRGFAEVMACRALYSVPAVAERNLVQVRFEDLLLRVVTLHLARRSLLTKLAAKTAIAAVDQRRMHVADELLRDGAGTASLAEDVVLQSAGDPDDINAIVLIEPVIFDGDECLAEVFGQRADRDTGADLLADLADE